MFELSEITFYFPVNLLLLYLMIGLVQIIIVATVGIFNGLELDKGCDLFIGLVKSILIWPISYIKQK